MWLIRKQHVKHDAVLHRALLWARTGDGGEDHTNHFWWQGKFYRLDDETGPEADGAAQPQQEEAESALTGPADGGIIDKKTPPEEKPDVYTVGHIDRDIYKCVTEDIQTDEVIITDERIAHIKERHPNDFERYSEYIADIVAHPQYILEANKPNTAFLLKEYAKDDERFQMILRLTVTGDVPGYKNSVITFLKVEEKRFQRYLRTKNILYKSE